jgi:DNA processing protein
VTDLALAAYASETGSHLVVEPRTPRYESFVRTFDASAYEARLRERGLRFVARASGDFPQLLRSIHDPPPGLFLRGAVAEELLSRPAVAVVGARACSPYGAEVARLLGRELAAAGLVVVSGMARGIDGEAHRGALESAGATIAVLGCGIDRDYPAAHASLARSIEEVGLIASEYAPAVEPAPWRFPARNRIIAGLVQAVVVVEARERSGALITADLALEEGRDVFAVPGEITSRLSAGTNRLLAVGAIPLTRPADVLEHFCIEPQARQAGSKLDPRSRRLYDLLRETPATADELAQATGLPAADLALTLTMLELEGLVAEGEGLYRVVVPTG